MKQKNGRHGTIQCREDLKPDCDKHGSTSIGYNALVPNWCWVKKKG